MEYESDPPDSDDDLDDPHGPEDDVECRIVATFSEELGIPCQNPDCPRYIPIPHPSSVTDPSRESGPPSGPSPGAGPSGVYGSLGGDSSSQEDDICLPCKESMHVHRDPPIASGPGEMPARMTPTPAEMDLLLQNVIEQSSPPSWTLKSRSPVNAGGSNSRGSKAYSDWICMTNGACKFTIATAGFTENIRRCQSSPPPRQWRSMWCRWSRRWSKPFSRWAGGISRTACREHHRELAERAGTRGGEARINWIAVSNRLSCVLCPPLLVWERNCHARC